MRKVYIVLGATGSYDCTREWYVLAYLDKSKAENHAELAEQRANQIQAVCKAREVSYVHGYETDDMSLKNEHDPNMYMDVRDGGTQYYVHEVSLAE